MATQTRRGLVLVQVLWILAILTVIAGSMSFAANLDIRLNRMFLDEVRGAWAARAGVETAIGQLALHGREAHNHPGLAWWSGAELYRDVPVGEAVFTLRPVSSPGSSPSHSHGLGDMESRINPNTASEEVLRRLPGMTRRAARGIVTLRGGKNTVGGGAPTGRTGPNTPIAGARKRPEVPLVAKPIEFLDQLLQADGVTPALLRGVGSEGGLDRYLTVRSNGKVNVNTASPVVLRALGLSAAEADEVVAGRGRGKWFTDPNAFLSQFPSADRELVTVRSRNFRVACTGRGAGPNTTTVTATLTIGEERVHVIEQRMTHGYARPTAPGPASGPASGPGPR